MKAKPVKLVPIDGYVECSVDQATHLTIYIPGPHKRKLTLPVIQGNYSRSETNCWSWNGSVDSPTLKPSILTIYESSRVEKNWRCHSWVNDGVVQFLQDCSHQLACHCLPLLDAD